MFVRQLQGRTADFAVEFAERYNRTGEGDCADKHAQEHLNQMNGVHTGSNIARFDKAVEAHQYRGQADEAVQQGNQFGHFGHLYFFGFVDTDGGTDAHGENHPEEAGSLFAEYGGKQGNRHAGDAEIAAVFSGFLFRQTGQRENKQNGGNDIGRSY